MNARNATAFDGAFEGLRAKRGRTTTAWKDDVDIYGPYTSTADVRNIRPTAASANSAYASIASESHSSAEAALVTSHGAAISSAEAAMSYNVLNATGTEGNVFTFTASEQSKRDFDVIASMTIKEAPSSTIPEYLLESCVAETLEKIETGMKLYVIVFEDSSDVRVDGAATSCNQLAEAVMNADPGIGPHPFKASYDSLQWSNMPSETIRKVNEHFAGRQTEIEDA